MFVRISLGVTLILSGILTVHAAESGAAVASGASSTEQVKRTCRQVWKHDHYEEKCRTTRHAPPPPPRLSQPPSPPNSRKDGPQSGPVRHPQGSKDVRPVSVNQADSASSH
jgi:phage tail tape-measure protein